MEQATIGDKSASRSLRLAFCLETSAEFVMYVKSCSHQLSYVAMALTEVQFTILDGMADDYEDIEQLYLYANRDLAREAEQDIELPRALLQVRFPLRSIVDGIATLLREGYIEAKYSNDEKVAPLRPLNFTALHHYWFGATAKGTEARKAYSRIENR